MGQETPLSIKALLSSILHRETKLGKRDPPPIPKKEVDFSELDHDLVERPKEISEGLHIQTAAERDPRPKEMTEEVVEQLGK
jgi:hypothetical protein